MRPVTTSRKTMKALNAQLLDDSAFSAKVSSAADLLESQLPELGWLDGLVEVYYRRGESGKGQTREADQQQNVMLLVVPVSIHDTQ